MPFDFFVGLACCTKESESKGRFPRTYAVAFAANAFHLVPMNKTWVAHCLISSDGEFLVFSRRIGSYDLPHCIGALWGGSRGTQASESGFSTQILCFIWNLIVSWAPTPPTMYIRLEYNFPAKGIWLQAQVVA